MSLAIVLVAAAVRVFTGQPDAALAITRQVSGSFVFTDPGSHHPITVWFCRPPSLAPDTRIVFIMHGSESETARQACTIASPDISNIERARACAAVLPTASPAVRLTAKI